MKAKKKRFIIFLSCFLLLLALGSCSSGNGITDGDNSGINQQTILVYMPWTGSNSDNGLYSIFLQNLDSIEEGIKNSGGLSNKKVLVFLSTSATNSQLYEIIYNRGDFIHKSIKDYTGNFYTSASGITEILNDMKTNAPALNYALIIGSHGTGWTYKDDWTHYPYEAMTTSYILTNLKTKLANLKIKTRFFGSVTDLKNYATDIPTLAEGIAGAGVKFQYILFDDCYMANVETAYTLRNVTNFLVASTSEVMDIGMPYKEMWGNLSSQAPSYTSLVSEFYDFYKNYQYPYGALSAIDCRKMDGLAAIMKKINKSYSLSEDSLGKIQVLGGYNSPIFYDLYDYVNHLTDTNHQKIDEALLKSCQDAIQSLVRNTAHTSSIYTALRSDDNFIPITNYCGIAISDPSINRVALKGKEKTEWWKTTH